MEENQVKEAIRVIKPGCENAIEVAKEMLADGKEKVTLVLKNQKTMPERMESCPRAHIFHDAAGFIAYLEKNVTPGMVVLADIDSHTVYAVLNDTSENGFETITLSPPQHPRFKLLREGLLAGAMDVAGFAKGILRNRAVIQPTDKLTVQDLALAMQQINIAGKTEQAIGVGKIATNGIMCETDVSGQLGKERVDIPDSIEVTLPIYLNCKEKTFGLDVTVMTERGQVYILCDSPELELKKFETFEDILTPIKAMSGVIVSYGQPKHNAWDYNK